MRPINWLTVSLTTLVFVSELETILSFCPLHELTTEKSMKGMYINSWLFLIPISYYSKIGIPNALVAGVSGVDVPPLKYCPL